ncbi:hypothetical protein HPP92_010861 [Vanilla planifolia]|uniref:Uncharacterized protein n=1 Tax=Vanilla planifolia TaxID=51239 RepID=A0A835RAA3_VANPL|nr:hypothetical protein HPP92_010861 [Vanilla planifolia]
MRGLRKGFPRIPNELMSASSTGSPVSRLIPLPVDMRKPKSLRDLNILQNNSKHPLPTGFGNHIPSLRKCSHRIGSNSTARHGKKLLRRSKAIIMARTSIISAATENILLPATMRGLPEQSLTTTPRPAMESPTADHN